MSTQLETALLKKTPCNGCRERKRKCSYEQPCARCVKFNIECTYTVMPSPKDIEYIQELEYMKQIEAIQHQITCMEGEMSTLKLAQENYEELDSPSPTPATPIPTPPPPPSINENPDIYHDYPSPVSMASINDHIAKKARQHHHQWREYSQEPSGFVHYHHPYYQRVCDQLDINTVENQKIKEEYAENFLNRNPDDVTTIAKLESIEAILSKERKKKSEPWTLTVKNGNMTIETHITSHSDLMMHMSSMIQTSLYQKSTSKLPFPLSNEPWVPKSAIGAVLSVLIWRKYGKSRFKSMTKYTPTLLHYEPANELAKVAPVENIANITMQLVYTYFQCLHLKFLHIHVPTFLRLFMQDEEHVMKSPVVMALCSDICHQTCKHITHIIPNNALTDYGLYYFEQARELIANQFDEANLETLLTYTYMAIYKVKTKNDTEGDRYLSMAERIYNILLPQYKFKDGAPTSGESILYARVYRSLYHIRSVIQLHDLTENMYTSRSVGPRKMFKLLDNQDNLDIYIADDDTPKEVQFIKMRRYLCQLREAIKDGARCAAANDFPAYIGVFGHHIEMAMRHWYRNVLPPEFQLSLPLFEDDTSDIEFFTKLELECGDSPIAILTTLSLYNEYLIMSKSYLPKDPGDLKMNTEDLLKRFKDMQNNIPMTPEEDEKMKDKTHYWLKILEKMKHFKKHHHDHFTDEEIEEDDEAYFTRFIYALNPGKINFDMPFVHTSIRTALNMVRIIQFLLSREYSCFLDLRWVMNAWEVLLRAAKFKYQQPGDEEVTLDRIRANLILCLNIIRDQIKFSRRDSSGSFVDVLEQEFNKLF